ncbi:MAG TPA: hypothetical protein VGO14_03205 [Solirubrobacteraceae bacterium]|jgi:hypothetical protein|nr:hypothetical protein [Solirubrobacteraceae bacterium]
MSSRLNRPARFVLAPRARVATLVLAATVLSCLAPPALSAPSGLVVVPRPISQPGLSYFKLVGRPGSTARPGTIELRNPTDRPLRVVLSAVDGETLGTLGSSYAPPGSRGHGPTLWLQIDRRAIALPPRTSVSVAITVRVPRAAKAGDYLSGVSAEALDQRPRNVSKKGVSIASIARYAIGVETSVPGPRHPLIQFTGAEIQRQPAGLAFMLDARNPGNTILQGVHGFVRITRGSHVVLARTIETGTFVTHTRIAYPVTAFNERPTQGTRYRIVAWMHYAGGTARLDTNVTFGHRQADIARRYAHATPATGGGTAWWKIAGVAAALAYALFTTVLLLRRRERRPREAPQQQ